MVACPRNQRYLQPLVIRPGALVCEANEGSKLAVKLNLELPILGDQMDLINKGADCFGRFRPRIFPVQGVMQFVDLAAVEIGEPRVQPGDGRCQIKLA